MVTRRACYVGARRASPALLWMSSSDSGWSRRLDLVTEVGGDGAVDFAHEVPFEAADDHLLGASLGESSGHVGLRRCVPAQTTDDDHVQRPVGVAVAVAVEAVVLLPTGGGVDRGDPAQGRER